MYDDSAALAPIALITFDIHVVESSNLIPHCSMALSKSFAFLLNHSSSLSNYFYCQITFSVLCSLFPLNATSRKRNTGHTRHLLFELSDAQCSFREKDKPGIPDFFSYNTYLGIVPLSQIYLDCRIGQDSQRGYIVIEYYTMD